MKVLTAKTGPSPSADWTAALTSREAGITQGTRHQTSSLAPYFMLGLALMGMIDAYYVAQASYTGQPLRELIIEGANTVLNSPYARIFGMPLSYFGLVYYSYMFALAALLAFDPFSRGLRVGALLYAALGAFSSIYFMYLQLNYIHAVCIYCLFSAVMTFLLVIAAIWHFGTTTAGASRGSH